MSTIRIATFNCENLFRRSRIFAERDPHVVHRVLSDVAALERILTHSGPSSPRATSLYKRVQPVVPLCTARGSTKTGTWSGWLAFRSTDLFTPAQQNTARVARALGADVLAVMEVENLAALRANVGLLSKYPARCGRNSIRRSYAASTATRSFKPPA